MLTSLAEYHAPAITTARFGVVFGETAEVSALSEVFFGTMASAESMLGAGRRSDWHRWESTGRAAESRTGSGFGERYADDLGVLATLGLTHLALPVDWSRVEPHADRIDGAELEWLDQVIAAATDLGVHLWPVMHHTSLPGWFGDDTDGFRTTDGPSIHWSRHVDRMAEFFDDRVAGWYPMVDPIGWAIRSHFSGVIPPGRQSLEDAHDAIEGVVDAQIEAARLLSSGSKPVVGALTIPTYGSASPEADAQRRTWDQTSAMAWIEGVRDGVLRWPWRGPRHREDMAKAFDAISIGYASTWTVDRAGGLTPHGDRFDGAGRDHEPQRFGDVLHRVIDELGDHEIFVHGLGVASTDDAWRRDLHTAWLDQLAMATNDGLKLRGVFFEPGIDGYDHRTGFDHPSGLLDRSRDPKASFDWIDAQ